MKREKIIYSLLKEIEKGGVEPRAKNYGISIAEFGNIVEIIENGS